jgi:hypothetical protein
LEEPHEEVDDVERDQDRGDYPNGRFRSQRSDIAQWCDHSDDPSDNSDFTDSWKRSQHNDAGDDEARVLGLRILASRALLTTDATKDRAPMRRPPEAGILGQRLQATGRLQSNELNSSGFCGIYT